MKIKQKKTSKHPIIHVYLLVHPCNIADTSTAEPALRYPWDLAGEAEAWKEASSTPQPRLNAHGGSLCRGAPQS